MGTMQSFLGKFGGMDLEETSLPSANVPNMLDAFMEKFTPLAPESYFFYNNTIELRFNVTDHKYYKVGELGQLIEQYGVTSVLKVIDKSAALVPWGCKMMAEKLLRTIPLVSDSLTVASISLADFTKLVMEAKGAHKEKLEEAGDIGHAAHQCLEDSINYALANDSEKIVRELHKLPEDEKAKACAVAALNWMQAHYVRWIKTEQKIYSREYGYAGTMDGKALVDSCDDPACCTEHFKDSLSIVDWKCLLPEQTLLKSDGSTIRADQAMPGDVLLAFDQATQNFIHDKIKEVIPGGTQPCVEVVTKHGRRMRVSSNHPVLVNGKWVCAEVLKSGDPLFINHGEINNVSQLSEDDARLLGYFIGDGGFSDQTCRTFTNTNLHVLDDFMKLCKAKGFTVTTNGKQGTNRNHYNIGGCGSFLRDHGIYCCGSKIKHVPEAVLSGSREAIIAFLSAYFDCDGYISKLSIGRPDACFTTVSERLAADVQGLLYRLGVCANVWKQENKKYKKRRHDSPPYWIKVNARAESKRLLQLLRFRVNHKEQRRLEWLKKLESVVLKPYPNDFVTKVVPLGSFPTIAIEMEKTGTFITSGIITHNSSNDLHVEYILQAAGAYEHAEREEYGEDIQNCFILRLGKNAEEAGKFAPWRVPARLFPRAFEGFLLCLNLVKLIDELKEWISTQKKGVREIKKKQNAEQKEIAKMKAKAEKEEARAKLKLERTAEKERIKAEAKKAREEAKLASLRGDSDTAGS